MQTRHLIAAALCLGCAASLPAQYVSNLENLTASAAGTPLAGQDGYYLPVATSVDFNTFTYTGNTLGVSANPTGGSKFLAVTGPGGGVFGRAQRNLPYARGNGVWTIGFDICGLFLGTLPTAQNLGSVSLQSFPGAQSFIALATWTDINTAANWNADMIYFDSAGTQVQSTVANPAFQGLATNQWYRWEIDFDLNTNLITELRLTDLTTSTTSVDNPVGWYMFGGAASAPSPTGFRFFSGGGVAGNTLCFDNPRVVPKPGIGDVLYYKFGGGCGDQVVNYGDAGIAPETGAILTNNPTPGGAWTAAGMYGSGLTHSTAAAYHAVNSGFTSPVTGSFSMAWWMNGAGLTPPPSTSYLFSGIGSFRGFTGGVAGTGFMTRAWGGTPADLTLTTDIQTLATLGWFHLALVVDGAAGTATYYVNGVAQPSIAITGSVNVVPTTTPFRVGMHTSTTTALFYDLDEFHFANRAYSAAEVATLATVHPAADATYSTGCISSNSLRSRGGKPTMGNATYALNARGPANGSYFMIAGWDRCAFATAPLPFDLGTLLPAMAGCLLNTSADAVKVFGLTGANGDVNFPLPIPNIPALDQLPLYWQTILLDGSLNMSLTNAVSMVVGN